MHICPTLSSTIKKDKIYSKPNPRLTSSLKVKKDLSWSKDQIRLKRSLSLKNFYSGILTTVIIGETNSLGFIIGSSVTQRSNSCHQVRYVKSCLQFQIWYFHSLTTFSDRSSIRRIEASKIEKRSHNKEQCYNGNKLKYSFW